LALVALGIIVCRRADWSRGFSPDGVLAFAGGALALLGVWWSNHQSVKNLQEQLEAEKRAREEDSCRERYGTAAVLRSEIISIWELDLYPLSAAFRDVTLDAEATLLLDAVRLPPAPRRYFPVFERCADRVGLLSRESVSLTIQYYKRVGDLLLAWDEYNRCPEPGRESFASLFQAWKGLQGGYESLLDRLALELRKDSEVEAG
jgi:hypothetical protein